MSGYTDVEELLAKWLIERFANEPRIKVWIDPRLPENWNYTAPLVHIQRAGGGDAQLNLDNPLIDVGVYASIADNARVIAERVRSALVLELPGHTTEAGPVVSYVGVASAPSWAPDPDAFRRVATYRLVVAGAIA